MRFRSGFVLSSLLIALFSSSPAFSRNPTGSRSDERHLGRIIGMSAGAVGGFFLGYSLSDDDAIDATQKMTRNVVIGALAGAIGGYFAGRAVDRKVSHAYAPDSLTRSLAQAKAVQSLASPRFGREPESSPAVRRCGEIQRMALD
jgi:hypothetical protein